MWFTDMLKPTFNPPTARWLFVWLWVGAILAGFAAAGSSAQTPPEVRREFRGLWVATVDNIDWPSQRGLPTGQQQTELIALLDHAAALRLNAIILQVRPSCDTFYESKIEPWSEYLTGQRGRAPSPFYDPLAFAVSEAHKRGLELHAWFNPYRVSKHGTNTPASSQQSAFPHPEWVRAYGNSDWLDPAEEGTRQYSLNVILDVVRRYDIDGVHFDDYFYPYPDKTQTGRELDFPDSVSWGRYQAGGGKLSRADWRRENVDRFVQAVYQAIKKEKPWVKFGISPFGIWRPGNPPQITGLDACDKLFADSRKWFAEGWVDYLAPQLYWRIDDKPHSFPVLLRWWAAQNTRHRNLWPGMQVTGWKEPGDDVTETVREIGLTRGQAGASGNLLWHARPLLRDEHGVAGALQRGVYAAPALVPACPWLSGDRPVQPLLRAAQDRGELNLNWQSTNGPVWQWVLQKKAAGLWTTEILPAQTTSLTIQAGPANMPEVIALSAVNRFGNLSTAAIWRGSPGN